MLQAQKQKRTEGKTNSIYFHRFFLSYFTISLLCDVILVLHEGYTDTVYSSFFLQSVAGIEDTVGSNFFPVSPLTMAANRVVPGDAVDSLAEAAAPGDLSDDYTDTSEDSRKYICTELLTLSTYAPSSTLLCLNR